jgi:hypothetical protein
MFKLILINMLISTNIVSIRLIKRTKNVNKAENKVYTKDIVQGIYTIKKNTKEVIKKIKYFNKKSTTFVIN